MLGVGQVSFRELDSALQGPISPICWTPGHIPSDEHTVSKLTPGFPKFSHAGLRHALSSTASSLECSRPESHGRTHCLGHFLTTDQQ